MTAEAQRILLLSDSSSDSEFAGADVEQTLDDGRVVQLKHKKCDGRLCEAWVRSKVVEEGPVDWVGIHGGPDESEATALAEAATQAGAKKYFSYSSTSSLWYPVKEAFAKRKVSELLSRLEENRAEKWESWYDKYQSCLAKAIRDPNHTAHQKVLDKKPVIG